MNITLYTQTYGQEWGRRDCVGLSGNLNYFDGSLLQKDEIDDRRWIGSPMNTIEQQKVGEQQQGQQDTEKIGEIGGDLF